jgi:hypothetical protein
MNVAVGTRSGSKQAERLDKKTVREIVFKQKSSNRPNRVDLDKTQSNRRKSEDRYEQKTK